MNIVRFGCLALPVVLIACSSVAPVKVVAGDQCFRCRRYISNERTATETIDSNRIRVEIPWPRLYGQIPGRAP